MMGHTHVLVGVAVGIALAASIHSSPENTLVMAGVAGAAALLPDIDHPRSSIRRKLGIFGRVGFFWLSHRGLTHTWLFVVGLGAGALLALPTPLALALIAGYASHLIADMMTVSGLPVFWPLSQSKFYVLPYPIRIPTNSWQERMVDVCVLVVILWMVFQ